MNEKLLKITQHLTDEKVKKEAIKLKYKDKEKTKKLTQEERLTRLEELHNIV